MTEEQCCVRADNCPMFQLFKNYAFLEMWKIYYCHGEFGKCARYRLFKQDKPIPITLLPSGEFLPEPPKTGEDERV